jgi:ATP-binding cassette subfamily F protein uup
VRKLTNVEKRELEKLPAQLEALEAEQETLAAKLADPTFYQKEPAEAPKVKARLEAIEQETATAFTRWEELEALRVAGA